MLIYGFESSKALYSNKVVAKLLTFILLSLLIKF